MACTTKLPIPGLLVCSYNGFNLIGQDNSLQLDDDLLVASWQECIAELDRRKVATRTPDMKLVIRCVWLRA